MPDQSGQFDSAALLVTNVQPGIIDRAPDPATYLARVNQAVRAARGLCTVLADLCADTDAEVHAVLTGKVFPRQARVMNAADWVAALG